MWTDVMNPVTEALVAIVLAAVTALVAFAADWVRKTASKRQLESGFWVATAAVQAVEQVAGNMGWDGRQKFQHALAEARKLGEAQGLKFSDEQWHTMIEHTVLEVHKELSKLDPDKAALHGIGPSGSVGVGTAGTADMDTRI